MKKVIVISVLLVGLAFGFAYAHNSGSGMRGFGSGGHMMGGNSGGHMVGGNYDQGGHMMGGGSGMMGSGMMRGYGGDGDGYANPDRSRLSRNGRNSEVHQKYLQDTAGMRKELHNKRFEYMEARRNPASNGDQLAALEREMYELRLEIQEKAEQYR